MFSSPDEVKKFIEKEGVEFIDVRFTDLPGQQQHFNVPAATLPDDFFTEGVMFDGSSIRGFAAIHKSDMKLIPDPSTAYVDPFRAAKTLNVAFSIVEPRTGEPYERDPRQVATKAEEWLKIDRHRRHRLLRPRGRVLRLRRRAVPDLAERGLLPHRLDRGRLEHRPRRGRRQPRLQDAVQGRLLPRPAGRPLRRPARPDEQRADRGRASRSSGRTTRSAPPARPRSTTSSTR